MLKVGQKAVENLVSSSDAEKLFQELMTNNKQYSLQYDKSIYDYRAPPSKHLAVITCMDARLDVFRMLGLKPGEAHIIRTGGGRVRDATRSLVCSQSLLQTNKVMIIHHTDCGYTYFKHNFEVLAALKAKRGTELPKALSLTETMLAELGLKKATDIEKVDPSQIVEVLGQQVNKEQLVLPDFMPITDLEQSVKDDLLEYKNNPLFDQKAALKGFIYDTKTGLLNEITP